MHTAETFLIDDATKIQFFFLYARALCNGCVYIPEAKCIYFDTCFIIRRKCTYKPHEIVMIVIYSIEFINECCSNWDMILALCWSILVTVDVAVFHINGLELKCFIEK